MKWNWGTKLFIGIAAFMMMLIVFAVLMIREDINLVESDYYPKGQTHQDLIEKRQNASSLLEEISLKIEGNVLFIQFPAVLKPADISGKIHLYHIAEEGKDALFALQPDMNGIMQLEIGSLHGRYILKMDWKYQETNNYTEKPINIL